MKSKKLKLDELNVQSFATGKGNGLKGGTDSYTSEETQATNCFNCPTLEFTCTTPIQ